jgi:AcrR family transcriptional regulator
MVQSVTSADVPGPAGLRDRKKARTRQEISDVATRLFAARGFEPVTLSEIAAAADVSVKTIFNHFGSKEDLYFDRADEATAALVDTISGRPAGTTVLAALRALLVDNVVPFPGRGWDGMDDPAAYEEFRRFLATQDRSPALRARRLTLGEELGDRLAPLLARELGRDPEDVPTQTLATMLIALLQLRDRVLREAVAERAEPAVLRRRVTDAVEDACGRLEAAFADVDRPAAPQP